MPIPQPTAETRLKYVEHQLAQVTLNAAAKDAHIAECYEVIGRQDQEIAILKERLGQYEDDVEVDVTPQALQVVPSPDGPQPPPEVVEALAQAEENEAPKPNRAARRTKTKA